MRFAGLLAVALTVGAAGAHAVAAATPVTVEITDTRTTLSRPTALVGVVALTIKNVGRRTHDFTIGTLKLRLLPGRGTTLRVPFFFAGSYAYRGTSRGVLKIVEQTPPTPPPPVAAVSGTSAPSPAPAAAGPGPCIDPSVTTVRVTMTDAPIGGFTFSPNPLQCGTVTFVLINAGQSVHGLQLVDPTGTQVATGPPIGGSQSTTVTATLSIQGQYEWQDSQAQGLPTNHGNVYVR